MSSLASSSEASVQPRIAAWIRAAIVAAAFVALLGLAFAVRLAPHQDFYPIPGGYRAYSVYDIRHILEHGHELRGEEVIEVTSYSSGIYLGTEDILRHKLEAAILLLLGLDAADLPAYYRVALWSPLVIFPLAVLAIYGALARASGGRPTFRRALALVAFAALGSFHMLSVSFHGETNTSTGWAFMMLAVYGLLRMESSPFGGRVTFFGFSILLTLLYHTSAVILAASALTLALFSLRRSAQAGSYTMRTAVVVITAVIAYFMYVSVSFFVLFAQVLGNAPTLLAYLLRQQADAPRDVALTDLVSTADLSFKVPLAIHAAFVAAPFAVLVVLGLAGRLGRMTSPLGRDVILPWVLGIVPFAAGLFLWSGFSGVMWKAGEFGSLFSILALAVLLSAPRLPALLAAGSYFVVVACVLLSASLFFGYQQDGPSHLSLDEQRAGEWLARVAREEEAVFTDLRLAAPLISNGHLAVVGINDYEQAETVRRWLNAIYYGSDPGQAVSAMREIYMPPGMTLTYAMFSARAEQDLPGIKGFDYTFKGAAEDFMAKFAETSALELVYERGGVRIYRFKVPPSTDGTQ